MPAGPGMPGIWLPALDPLKCLEVETSQHLTLAAMAADQRPQTAASLRGPPGPRHPFIRVAARGIMSA